MTTSNLISLGCLALIFAGVVGIVMSLVRRRANSGRSRRGAGASEATEGSASAGRLEAGLAKVGKGGVSVIGTNSGRANGGAEELGLLARQGELRELLAAVRQATAEATQRLTDLEQAKAELGEQAAAMEEYLADLRSRHEAAVALQRAELGSRSTHQPSAGTTPQALQVVGGAFRESKPTGGGPAAKAASTSQAGRASIESSTQGERRLASSGSAGGDGKEATAEVLRLAGEGRSSIQIARELALQPGVVELILALRGRK